MNLLKKGLGKVLHAITDVLSFLLDVIIQIIDFTVTLVNTIAQGFRIIIGMGGCLLFFMFSPYFMYLLFNPLTFLLIAFFIIFPILGSKFVSYLKYIKYMLTEFLYDRANYLIHGTDSKYSTFSEYGYKYKKAEDAKRRKEQQERQYQQQREWEERFRQWQQYQNNQREYYGDYRQSGGGGYSNYNTGYNGQSYNNPTSEFKKKYEESCDMLGVPYNADVYQIKLAYRKKAKQYHPDVNKSSNATGMFQKINDAYEFLSEKNIEMYKKMVS